MPIVIIGAESNRNINCNLAATRIYGYRTIEEVIGKTLLDFSPPVHYDTNDSSVLAVFYINKDLILTQFLFGASSNS